MNIFSKLKYLILAPFLGLVLYALSMAMADAFSYQALLYERRWITEEGMAERRDWDAAVGWSKLAMKFDPYNPNYSEMLGRLYFWRFFIGDSPIESYEEAQLIANDGLNYLRASIEKRPAWPRAWASIVQLKSVSSQIDYEFEQVWDRAVALGDWEPEVQTILLEAGLIHWGDFNDVLRDKTVSMFVAMTSKPFSELRAIRVVDRIGAWPLVCNVLVDPILTPDRMRQACAGLLKSQQEDQAERNL
jgi:hypothetical protein